MYVLGSETLSRLGLIRSHPTSACSPQTNPSLNHTSGGLGVATPPGGQWRCHRPRHACSAPATRAALPTRNTCLSQKAEASYGRCWLCGGAKATSWSHDTDSSASHRAHTLGQAFLGVWGRQQQFKREKRRGKGKELTDGLNSIYESEGRGVNPDATPRTNAWTLRGAPGHV